ncbi:cell wall-active antibiotics response protein LiaF [Cytobacillus purgationiresistens]|uniref:Lia operon protein LiaF n=1 Tax=Cytobacillus purgationiresistens TaxID=863449 RepID=A0ABU0AL99_9BACI|nr:cell wall-active antibiotics response protein LiaF [Cytobacillus purgationiresistens]MDQ0271506.1 lia operon protein LiaF [Cytobacillus purgationiresistens]
MYEKFKNDYMGWIFLVGIVVLFLEIVFFNHGVVFSLLLNAGMIYFGRKWMPKMTGKILFWLGIFLLIISILSMITFKFLLLAILIHFLIQFAQSKKNPQEIKPVIKEPVVDLNKETMVKKKSVLSNVFFGHQKTPETVFEWSDVNIQCGMGDTVIDLSYTVLPKGETVIIIKNLIGNIQVLVPYDVEASINHSVIAGSTQIFEVSEKRIFNQNLQVQTAGFEQANQRVKIVSSLLVGDIEVKRV